MRLTKLIVENFKRITAATIPINGAITKVGGKNRAGKSSALDALEAALGGVKHAPGEPIHAGAKSARIVVETDEITVTRKFTAKGSTLEVKNRDGATFPSPQAMLDALVGPLSFDPLEFTRQKPEQQAETLRRLAGLDFTEHDAMHAQTFAKRTEVGRDIKRLQGAVDSMPDAPDGTPDVEVSVAALSAELQAGLEKNQSNQGHREALEKLRALAESQAKQVKALEEQLAKMRESLEQTRALGKAKKAEVAALVDADVAAARQAIADAERTNAAVRAKAAKAKAQAELDAAIEESEALTFKLTDLDAAKAGTIAAAKYPIDGLTIGDDGVRFGSVPFAQASAAEQTTVAAAIGLALNPKLRVMLIRDGSLLDDESMAALQAVAEKADAQVLLEVVSSDGKGCTVLIEDGAVAAEKQEPARANP